MVASTGTATQLTNSADIFGGGTLSSPDTLKTGTTTGGTDQSKKAESESAKLFTSFDSSKVTQGLTAPGSIGAGLQPLVLAQPQPQPYNNYGQPQNQGAAANTAAPAANATAASAAPAAQGNGITVGGKKEKGDLSNKEIVERLQAQGWKGENVKELNPSMLRQINSGKLSIPDAYAELKNAQS